MPDHDDPLRYADLPPNWAQDGTQLDFEVSDPAAQLYSWSDWEKRTHRVFQRRFRIRNASYQIVRLTAAAGRLGDLPGTLVLDVAQKAEDEDALVFWPGSPGARDRERRFDPPSFAIHIGVGEREMDHILAVEAAGQALSSLSVAAAAGVDYDELDHNDGLRVMSWDNGGAARVPILSFQLGFGRGQG